MSAPHNGHMARAFGDYAIRLDDTGLPDGSHGR